MGIFNFWARKKCVKCGANLIPTNYVSYGLPNYKCPKCGRNHHIKKKSDRKIREKPKVLTAEEFIEVNKA